MSENTELYIDLVVVLSAFLIGLYRYSVIDRPSRVLLLLLLIILIDESVGHIFSERFGNNMVIYNSYSLVELFLISLYFNYTIKRFRKRNIGCYIGALGLIFGVLNFSLLQPLNSFSTSYLLFEGFFIILMSLISFYYLLLSEDDLKLYRQSHFWFTSVLLFFWSVTYVAWGIFPLIHSKTNIKLIESLLWVVNIISYSSIAIIFLLYPKLQATNE